jgi:tetratricopeptide (TPR) repeat protein
MTLIKVSIIFPFSLFFLPLFGQEMFKNETPPFFSIEGYDSENSDMNLFNYISENMEYPKSLRDNCISGTVLIQFTLDSSGKVVKDSLLIENYPSLVKEAKKVFYSTSGHWIPATLNGKKTSIQLTIPFKFSIRGLNCIGENEYFQLGLGYFEKQDYYKSATNFKMALRKNPFNSDYLFNTAVAYLKQHKIDSACYYLNSLPILDEDIKNLNERFCTKQE